jgi:sorbitol-specific phosphotransferase system component IIC
MIMLFPVLYKRFDSTVATNLIKSEFLLQLATVFVLTSAIIILGIGQFIDRQQLPVLLASISGYVLGQLGKA